MDGLLVIRVRLPLVVVLALVVQTAVLDRIRLVGVAPDLMLLLAIAAGVAGGPERGAVTGFLSGIAIDLFLQTPVGLSALAFSLVGYVVGMIGEGVLRSAWWIPLTTALVATVAGEMLFAMAGAVVGESQLMRPHLAAVAAIAAVLNAVLAPLALRMMRWAVDGTGSAAGAVRGGAFAR